jgi:hypothetical protein
MEINGGGGSSFKKLICGKAKGPIKTILIGNIILDVALFHAIGESLPVLRTESGGLGNPCGPVVPKSDVVIKRKANPEMRKRITNLFLEMFIFSIIEHRIFRVSCRGCSVSFGSSGKQSFPAGAFGENAKTPDEGASVISEPNLVWAPSSARTSNRYFERLQVLRDGGCRQNASG